MNILPVDCDVDSFELLVAGVLNTDFDADDAFELVGVGDDACFDLFVELDALLEIVFRWFFICCDDIVSIIRANSEVDGKL